MLIEGGSLRRVYRKPCLIIYQRRHRRCCRSIPSHQFAAVPPCSQRRHILIYPNVLHTNNPSQFPNRANHPIALTLPAIQGGPPPSPLFIGRFLATGFQRTTHRPSSKVFDTTRRRRTTTAVYHHFHHRSIYDRTEASDTPISHPRLCHPPCGSSR